MIRNMLVAAVTVCAVALPTAVHAEKQAGSAAWARLGSERKCIRYDFGRAVNTCIGAVIVNMTPRIKGSGDRNFFATGDGGTQCQAVRVNRDGLQIATTGWKTLVIPNVGSDPHTFVGSHNIGSTEMVVFECVLPASGRGFVGSIEY
jgi:hypothetical protein